MDYPTEYSIEWWKETCVSFIKARSKVHTKHFRSVPQAWSRAAVVPLPKDCFHLLLPICIGCMACDRSTLCATLKRVRAKREPWIEWNDASRPEKLLPYFLLSSSSRSRCSPTDNPAVAQHFGPVSVQRWTALVGTAVDHSTSVITSVEFFFPPLLFRYLSVWMHVTDGPVCNILTVLRI